MFHTPTNMYSPDADLAGTFIARAQDHWAAGNLRMWAACLRLASQFATDLADMHE